jgi:hypothetical protein
MPLSPAQRMKQSAQKMEGAIKLSDEAKAARSKARKEKEKTDEPTVPAWAITLIAIVVVGSVFAQIYFAIAAAPIAPGADTPQPEA